MWLSRSRPAPRSIRRGGSRLALGPLTVTIRASRETVFDVIAAPYLGRTPRAMADKLHVVERGSDLVVADHFTPIVGGRFVVTTRETVGFDRPERIRFRLLSGPVANVTEEYRLTAIDSGTTLVYSGELASALPVLGSWWARTNATTWVEVVRRSLTDVRSEAERRWSAGS